MFPFCFEWVNDAAHFVFMGSLYTVLGLVFVLLNYCGIRAFLDYLYEKEVEDK